ncbi:hypothetical protein SAMN04487779_10733 [Belnapia rosea]|uniref:Glycosyl transferase family 2 n=1 Tax=Belnapia rosea TaxID=938405 RepID=A0A1G7EEJ3_9PROT|nr:hypothetical protein SAMN04487779_10733 [Belnapia rosea]
MRVSGYLSIYNDWDLLAPALRSAAPYLDELVVVDGAYSWMAELLRQMGRRPERSEQPVRDAIAAAGLPVRIIESVWANELEKRRAGYEACCGRYVLRLDADEILFVDEPKLERFLASGAAVAEMEMPTYIVPGFIHGSPDSAELPRQALLFDRTQVSAEEHLSHLWLVLTADRLAPAERRPVFPDPIAFNAHLTTWRTPRTAVQRALFYSLNWSRQHGVAWIEALRGRPLTDAAALTQHIPAAAFLEAMLSHRLVSGHVDTAGEPIRGTPLSPVQEEVLLPLHAQYEQSHLALNRRLRERPRRMIQTEPICLDLSGRASLEALASSGAISLDLFHRPRRAKAELRFMLPYPPWQARQPVPVTLRASGIRIDLSAVAEPEGFLRRVLVLDVSLESAYPIQTMQCVGS